MAKAKSGEETKPNKVANATEGSFISKAPKDLSGYDLLNHVIATGLDPRRVIPAANGSMSSAFDAMQGSLGTAAARKLFTAAQLFNSNKMMTGLSKEQRLAKFYEGQSNDPELEAIKAKAKNYFGTGNIGTMYGNSPLLAPGAAVSPPMAMQVMKK